MNLRTIRVLKKIDAEEAAKALGIKTSLLYSYESGRVKAKNEFLEKAANYYGVTMAEILENEELKAKNLLQSNDAGYWKRIAEEHLETVKSMSRTIEMLTSQLGKPEGNTDAVVTAKIRKCRVVRLQSGLHLLRQAS